MVRKVSSDDLRFTNNKNIIGNIYWKKDNLTNSFRLCNEALAAYKRVCDENHPAVAECSDRIDIIYEKFVFRFLVKLRDIDDISSSKT